VAHQCSKHDKKGLILVASQNGCALQCPEILAEQQTAFFSLMFANFVDHPG
jgi:adenine C2-methylase RlmN of 23S rRNA A2503 and tRNA A37